MIVLDTNVLSEPIQARPNAAVLDWLASQPEALALTSISVGELMTGIRLLPGGKRRAALTDAVEAVLSTYADSILPYDEHAARQYGVIAEARRRSGHPLSVEDGMIASICLSRGAQLATRNIKDFEGLGLDLIDPWQPGRLPAE